MSRPRPGRRAKRAAGREDILDVLATDYRLWARLPADVNALLAMAPPGANKTADNVMLAVVGRPTFPTGVCTGCGCSECDACPDDVGEGCHWIDTAQTRCSSCGPAPAPSSPRRARMTARSRRRR